MDGSFERESVGACNPGGTGLKSDIARLFLTDRAGGSLTDFAALPASANMAKVLAGCV
jgi:hypothetical protein